ncbi:Calcium-dependent protein kinase 11 [Gossypium australe]|uniref:non-specific serine/threonine protein kinase n=1 Tax=Gossypium australe TaxID=47621 RepID=A0A5B6WWT5_9ROSI|nr:Calcium-dependent protein kinase 11 [Gossypium australe]
MNNQSSSIPMTTATKGWVLPYETPRLRDHYVVGKKLGQGQFGTTYECIHKATGTVFACKSIPKRKLLCREDYDDVWREIKIMHHLSEHPSVVRIEGTYEDSVFVHLVMEICLGGELFDRIVAKGHYSEREAAKLIKTIVGVVEACHSLGVMHRDLKPENFLFDSPGDDAVLKATDFGLSIFYKPGWVLGYYGISFPYDNSIFKIVGVTQSLKTNGEALPEYPDPNRFRLRP